MYASFSLFIFKLTHYLDGVSVARNIASSEMTTGRKVAVVFFDESNAREAVVIAVYTQE
ncbi:MAG: hypothetical protein V1894_05960 [Chloroflexota bacterium]